MKTNNYILAAAFMGMIACTEADRSTDGRIPDGTLAQVALTSATLTDASAAPRANTREVTSPKANEVKTGFAAGDSITLHYSNPSIPSGTTYALTNGTTWTLGTPIYLDASTPKPIKATYIPKAYIEDSIRGKSPLPGSTGVIITDAGATPQQLKCYDALSAIATTDNGDINISAINDSYTASVSLQFKHVNHLVHLKLDPATCKLPTSASVVKVVFTLANGQVEGTPTSGDNKIATAILPAGATLTAVSITVSGDGSNTTSTNVTYNAHVASGDGIGDNTSGIICPGGTQRTVIVSNLSGTPTLSASSCEDGWSSEEVAPKGYNVVIRTAEELGKFRDAVNRGSNYQGADACKARVIQMANIDLSGIADWTPIGINPAFQGTYEGNGYTITGMNIDCSINTDNTLIGLFAQVSNPSGGLAVLSNIHIRGAKVINLEKSAAASVGTLASVISGTVISNCSSEGTIKYKCDQANIGGLIGMVLDSYMTNCSFRGDVTDIMTQGYALNVGGLIGLFQTSQMASCCTKADVIIEGTAQIGTTSNDFHQGGLSGYKHGGNALSCYAIAALKVTSTDGNSIPVEAGKLIGHTRYIDQLTYTVKSCYTSSSAPGEPTAGVGEVSVSGTSMTFPSDKDPSVKYWDYTTCTVGVPLTTNDPAGNNNKTILEVVTNGPATLPDMQHVLSPVTFNDNGTPIIRICTWSAAAGHAWKDIADSNGYPQINFSYHGE